MMSYEMKERETYYLPLHKLVFKERKGGGNSLFLKKKNSKGLFLSFPSGLYRD